MRKRVNYEAIVKKIKEFSGEEYILDQKEAKKIGGNTLPKSCFDMSYAKKKSNELFRFLFENEYEFEIVQPKIVIKKKT